MGVLVRTQRPDEVTDWWEYVMLPWNLADPCNIYARKNETS